jgi:hypothetical protein
MKLETTLICRTAILFLEPHLKREFIQYRWGVWTDHTPLASHGMSMFQQERPSQVTQVDSDAKTPVLSEDLNTSLIYIYIVAHANDLDIYGPGNALFLSLAALVELHLSKPPLKEPFFTGLFTPWLDDVVKQKYYSEAVNGKDGLSVEIRLLSSRLRSHVDEQRMMLRRMPRFVKKLLDTQQISLKDALNELVEGFELNLQDLELAEIRLKDQIAIQSFEQSTNMAQASIRESKRVMLRKYFHSIYYKITVSDLLRSDCSCIHFCTVFDGIFNLWNGTPSSVRPTQVLIVHRMSKKSTEPATPLQASSQRQLRFVQQRLLHGPSRLHISPSEANVERPGERKLSKIEQTM